MKFVDLERQIGVSSEREVRMILPFIGSSKGLFKGLGGTSRERGFAIGGSKGVIATSSGYSKDEELYSSQEVLGLGFKIQFVQVVIFGLILWFFSEGSPWLLPLWILLLELVCLFSGIYIAALVKVRGKDQWRQYHGCEHKVISLVEEGLEPTIENLRKMPKVHVFCGTSLVSMVFLTPLVFDLVLLLSYGQLNYVAESERLQTNLIMALLAGLLLSIPAIQRFFTVKEPSEAVLQEGVEVAKRTYQVLKSGS